MAKRRLSCHFQKTSGQNKKLKKNRVALDGKTNINNGEWTISPKGILSLWSRRKAPSALRQQDIDFWIDRAMLQAQTKNVILLAVLSATLARRGVFAASTTGKCSRSSRWKLEAAELAWSLHCKLERLDFHSFVFHRLSPSRAKQGTRQVD